LKQGATLFQYKGITSVIADGVSACERAAEASSCCVNSFLSDYYSTPDSWRVEHSATKVISALNNWLYSQSMRNDEISSMLSTLSVIIIKSNTAHIFHIGDSRIYRYRQGLTQQLLASAARSQALTPSAITLVIPLYSKACLSGI
jgi:protein phosphatase